MGSTELPFPGTVIAASCLVLVWLLYRPVAAAIARRRAAAAKPPADAAKAEPIRTALADEARSGTAGLWHEAQAVIARERGAALAELHSAAAELALLIARRLLTRLPPAVAAEAFRAALAADFAALAEPERRRFLDPGATVTVASAVPLEAPVRQACRAMLAGAGGGAFVTDPRLIAGIELRAPHATLRANWQVELQHIAAVLEGKEHGKSKQGQGSALDPQGDRGPLDPIP